MKILNLYAGIGGNRKLWGDEHEITAIEYEPKIAKIYQDFFPNDKVIIADAHQYLLEHYKEFDFIWSSPPCPSHSRIRKHTAVGRGQNLPIFPDMKLYEEILFLQGYFKGKFVVENVISWYQPLIKPLKIGRHFFWTNFAIEDIKFSGKNHLDKQVDLQRVKGFDISKYKIGIRKDKILRNCVEPEVGKHIIKSIL
jgi:DNA (cytosine-5)-methyltransferase 1